ncbi:hypothetical protein LCGC14_3053570, partial [marine sediment metagenome]
YNDLELEIALDLDLNITNRLINSAWSYRYRLLYYNYTTGYWEDYKGILRATNDGYDRTVWDPETKSDNFIVYLNETQESTFIPVYDTNDISIANPILIDNISNHTVQNDRMKLMFISYVLPGNLSIDSAGYFSYERAVPDIPIEIKQNLDVLECVFLGKSREIMYPESSIVTNLPLDQNFRANLSSILNLGEIVSVSGVYEDVDSISHSFSIHSYWVTQSNELAFNSPTKYLFTNVTIEYVPLAALEYNVIDGRWYLPQSLIINNYNFTEPFFASSLWVNSTSYGTYIHPDVDVGYYVGNSSSGIYIEFDDPTIDSLSSVKGAVHFGKRDDTYLYKFSLKDELLYKYNIIDNAS